MSAPALMLIAWGLEFAFGWPDWLYKRVRHPAVWIGALISTLENALNQRAWGASARYLAGAMAALTVVAAAAAAALGLSLLLPDSFAGATAEALVASSLIASRSLHAHIDAVARPLQDNEIGEARAAVSMIVGRDPTQLDEAGIARASLESLAENASDGVIAPLFWGAIFGLPGIAAYKAINTLDSMIGHKNERYASFGGFAARLDDVANFIPARMTGLLIAAAGGKRRSLAVTAQDARRHRSPNAGWPEAAMAGALGVRLSGPRVYDGHISDEPWLNEGARDPSASDVSAGLAVYRRAMALSAVLLGALVLGTAR
ncbi:MAG: adenosylcobinamide-phosphate synthase CbiB [Pseudomonadota bacterium]